MFILSVLQYLQKNTEKSGYNTGTSGLTLIVKVLMGILDVCKFMYVNLVIYSGLKYNKYNIFYDVTPFFKIYFVRILVLHAVS